MMLDDTDDLMLFSQSNQNNDIFVVIPDEKPFKGWQSKDEQKERKTVAN